MDSIETIGKKGRRKEDKRGVIHCLEDVKAPIRSYRRKPIVVKAVKLPYSAVIKTSHGEVKADKGDYVVLDEKNNVYPCEKEIFLIRHEESRDIVCRQCGQVRTVFKGMIEDSTGLCFDCFKKDDPSSS